MLGSLTFYRRILKDNVFSNPSIQAIARPGRLTENAVQQVDERLPTIGHGIAGIMAGATVSFIAAPVEHIKARLQVQYAAVKSDRMYSGPIDCIKKIVRNLSPKNLFIKAALTHQPRHEPTGSGASTTVFQLLSSFAPSSSSGGAPTTFSPATSPTTPIYPRLPSISGPAASQPKSSGSPPTHPTSSSSES